MTDRRIAIVTGSRAEYGLLRGIIRHLMDDDAFEPQLIVTGQHLVPEFGLTVREIEDDGMPIAARVDILMAGDSGVSTAKATGLGVIGMAEASERIGPDLLLLLGDRFEILAAAQAALFLKIPIAHIHGGEKTAGAMDEAIRHSVTKMAHLHFTSTEVYRRRVIQLGEDPAHVFNVGAPGLDAIRTFEPLSREALGTALDIDLGSGPYFLVTYHPATLGDTSPETGFRELMAALDAFPDHAVILTYPNADPGGRRLIPLIEDYARERTGRVRALKSLGQRRYLSAVKHAAAVIGNSSSGIIEAPGFGVPTVDIGPRQAGRVAADSVFHCREDRAEITQAINRALVFAGKRPAVANPYGDGRASERIVEILKHARLKGLVVKDFNDIDFTVPEAREHEVKEA